MQLLALSIALSASTLALGHMQVGSHPAPHDRLARRAFGKNAPLVGRQRQTTTTAIDDDAETDTVVTTTVRSVTQTQTSAVVTTTTSRVVAVSSAVTTSPVIRSSPIVTSSSISSAVISSVASSSPIISSTSSLSSSTSSAASSSITPSEEAHSSGTSSVISTSSETSAPVMTITEDGGSVRVITEVRTAVQSASSAAASNDAGKKSDEGGISTGAIIGISVGAGAVVLALIALAIWRMKRRSGDEDDAIRWPELNRHGDSDTHHALPARQTGQHGFETGLERSLSNSSSIFAPTGQGHATSIHSHGAGGAPMALNGSNFGAASSLEDYDYNEKQVSPLPPIPNHPATSPYDPEEDYTNMPPALEMHQNPNANAYGGYDSEDDGQYPPRGAGPGYDGQIPMTHLNGYQNAYHHGNGH